VQRMELLVPPPHGPVLRLSVEGLLHFQPVHLIGSLRAHTHHTSSIRSTTNHGNVP
jgi:hypothetical protein